MATISARTFSPERHFTVAPDGASWTLTFTDCSPRHRERIWVLTKQFDAIWTRLARREANGTFLKDVICPRKITLALIAAAIRDGRLPINRQS